MIINKNTSIKLNTYILYMIAVLFNITFISNHFVIFMLKKNILHLSYQAEHDNTININLHTTALYWCHFDKTLAQSSQLTIEFDLVVFILHK